jgi:hypothetical protein
LPYITGSLSKVKPVIEKTASALGGAAKEIYGKIAEKVLTKSVQATENAVRGPEKTETQHSAEKDVSSSRIGPQ